MAKSGTLSYEAVASVTRAGLGQSLCIGMGGDVVAGTSLVDALRVFEIDPDTEGIIIIGELGGRAEEDAAAWIEDYHRRVKDPKSDKLAEYVAYLLTVSSQAHCSAGGRQKGSCRPYHGARRCLCRSWGGACRGQV